MKSAFLFGLTLHLLCVNVSVADLGRSLTGAVRPEAVGLGK